jgi:WD40 repeat protein/tRNA A-37 threonylcarbamoyl transferase component Bud32
VECANRGNRQGTAMPADPRRVKAIFGAALAATDPAARSALLDRECAGDPDLRLRLDDLLRAHDHPASALERPLAVAPGDVRTIDHVPTTGPGTVLAGRYKLLERIGEGGMGEVWVADQLEPIRRRVAAKMIKRGMDSKTVLARFEAERQALALMDHPNIAKVLDADTTDDGRPFFVMDLVKGTPITEFCDARKLSARERLGLFVQVCGAIQHAHQKGIIHRDVKPSNVLVALHDERPVPKVIDFGVAKAVGQQLTEKTVYTGFGALIGTPAYMAPEQATFNQLDVDTRADVYALGVLLYELLAGSPPFEPERLKQAALDEVLRLVREEEPPRPSARLSTSQAKATIAATRQSDPAKLSQMMRGELDWIVMKALEKDRARRYDTANGLAKDVERYLAGDAVEACPPTLGYRVRKFYRRHRMAVIATAAVAAAALLSVVGQTWNVWRARAAEADAVAARNAEAEQRDETARQRDAAVEARTGADRERAETVAALGKLRQAQDEQQAGQYVWDMQTVPLAFEAGNVAEVNRLLDRHVPPPGQSDRRGFEWFYWDRQLHGDLRTDRLPAADKRSGNWAASPDGSRIGHLTIPGSGGGAAGPKDESAVLTVWDVAARKVVLTHRMPPPGPDEQAFSKGVFPPLFSRDGKRVLVCWSVSVLSSSADGLGPIPRHRQVVDVATGKVLLQLDGGGVVPRTRLRLSSQSAFSPDGRRFAAVALDPATGNRERVRVWDLESGKDVCASLDADDLAESPFGPDGTRLVTVRFPRTGGKVIETRVSVWDLTGGQEAAGWNVPELSLFALAVSPDGKRVAGVMGERPAGAKGDFTRSEPRAVKVWDATTGTELHAVPMARLPGPGGQLVRAFFSPDGSRLAVERHQADWRGGAQSLDLTLLDPVHGKPLPSPTGLAGGSTTRILSGPSFSSDGRHLVCANGNVLRTWDVDTGQPVLALRGHVAPIDVRAFTADGKRLWSLDSSGSLKEWDVRPPGRVAIPLVASNNIAAPPAFACAVSPDGGRVAALDQVKTDGPSFQTALAVQVWDTAGKTVNVLVPPPRQSAAKPRTLPRYYGLALSRDGRRAVLARNDGAGPKANPAGTPPADLTVWDVKTGAVLLQQTLDGQARPNPAISPDGRLVAVATRPDPGAATHFVRVFDVDTRRERPPLTLPEVRSVSGTSFSPDGRRVAVMTVAGEATLSGRLTVWDLESGKPLYSLEMPAGPRFSGLFTPRFAWSPDGSRFAFSRDPQNGSNIEVFDAVTGQRLLKLDQPVIEEGASHVPSLSYSPDGKRIAAFLPPQSLWGPRVVKVWDATSGKELLTLRPPPDGPSQNSKTFTFSGDGHRLLCAEMVVEREQPRGDRRPSVGGPTGEADTVTRSLVLTTWDAAPVPGREPKGP